MSIITCGYGKAFSRIITRGYGGVTTTPVDGEYYLIKSMNEQKFIIRGWNQNV